MTPSFILDENIVILAQQGLDEYGNANPRCANLIQQIIEICHTLVVDDVLWDKYVEQLHRPGYHHPSMGPFLIRALYNALTVSEKVEGLGHTAPIMDDEGLIPDGSQDDAYLVRLAVETRAILVTTDGALRDDLESSGILSKYDLTVASPEDAMGLL
jgi:hypothetical protein